VPGPLARFNLTIGRCYGLIDHHRTQTAVGHPSQHLSDVLRATVVLGCAALDAFHVDTFGSALPRAQRAGLLTTAAPTTKSTRALVHDLRHPGTKTLETVARSGLRWITLMRPDALDELTVNVLGAAAPWPIAAAELGNETNRGWTENDVRARLTSVVERRDAIVHRGDMLPSGGTTGIRRSEVERDLLLLQEVARAVRSVVRARV
jgi:hypothetical protein